MAKPGKRKRVVTDFDLYDTAGVKFLVRQSKHRREIMLIGTSEAKDFNTLMFCLALREFLEKMETQLGLLDAAVGEH
jgi:hypothetical protein